MLRNVHVISNEDGRVLMTYPVRLAGLNYSPSPDEYFEVAKRQAIDDRIISENETDKVRFEFEDDV